MRKTIKKSTITAILPEAAIKHINDSQKLAINRTTIARSRQKARITFVQHLKKKILCKRTTYSSLGWKAVARFDIKTTCTSPSNSIIWSKY